ncbi:hypothetical protein ETAA8_34200 [Anatilimnocola aggregata]|uniref:SLA1 homology domain-containing protein n=1 Tax=Anatilimnocola aggregata TaxID=2528021 RepID=A0A517YDL6_9BACT|nr:SHD1 domain-containing protein [Anatilimnocola aggregata]QDU28320.1 hypothetical protein ETAA8_34200 [Anatilimnocola aggregata]
MNAVRSLLPICALVIGLLAAGTREASGANTYKEGDLIEVNFLGKWWPATVVATNARGDVMAEYEFAGGNQRKAFANAAVRYQCESGAIAPVRTWSDPSGTFKTKAALLKIEGEAIVIRKPDMKELTIQVANLSTSDQSFVKSLQKKVADDISSGKKWVEPPPLETFAAGDAFSSTPAFGAQTTAITPDPLPAYLKIKQGGVAWALDNFHDRISAVIPLGGTDSWILGVVTNGFEKEFGTRLYWVSLAKQKVQQRHMLPPGEVVLDYHPKAKRLLTQSGGGVGEETAYTLWGASPVEKELKPIVKWRAEKGPSATTPWARIIDEKLVLQRADKQKYIAWDTERKQIAYRVSQESFFAPSAIISGGRKYLVLPEDERVRIIDTTNGQTLTSLPAAASVSSVALSEDGTKLAALERYSLRIWDVTNPAAAEERIAAEAIGTPFSTTMTWVGTDRLMTSDFHGSLVLFSLKRRLALWTYELDMDARPEHGATRTHEIVDRHLVYAASVRQGANHGLAVGAVQLPGPKVDEADNAVDPASLLIVKPGTAVKLDVQCGEHDAQVRTALEAEIQKNGWVRDDNATTVLTASMKQGESQTVTYRLGGFGRPVSEESVTITPYISSLNLTVDQTVAWSSGTRTGAPGMVSLREGQTLQGEVERWQKPNPGFFATVDIPDSIFDPAKRKGMGTTSVTNRGLIPK